MGHMKAEGHLGRCYLKGRAGDDSLSRKGRVSGNWALAIASLASACVEPISKSFEEDDEAGQLDKAEEIVGVVLPANEDPALPLNPGEEPLDEPASHVTA
jgi:hypothetical protein